jgi:hypothetical protein
MIQELDKKWVQMELPLFVAAYGSQKAGYWQESIRSAAEKIKDLVSVLCCECATRNGLSDGSLLAHLRGLRLHDRALPFTTCQPGHTNASRDG